MGGNITVNGYKASPIVIDQNRWQVCQDIHDALVEMLQTKRIEYLGSARNLMDGTISTDELIEFKPSFGDIDLYLTEDTQLFLEPGLKYGKYFVRGSKKHGIDISVLMMHENGQVHQFDFVQCHYGPEAARFLHSSDWYDTRAGFKGLYHKILLNAVGLDEYKFSIAHGLRPRELKDHPGWQHAYSVSAQLFFHDSFRARSFTGLVSLMKDHFVKAEKHQAIIEKFEDSLSRVPGDHSHAVKYLKDQLGFNDDGKSTN